MEERARQGVNPKRVTQFLPGPVSTHGGNVLAPGTLDGSKSFGGFIVRNTSMLTVCEY